MDLKPFYSYDEVGALEGRTGPTIRNWVAQDFNLRNPEDRRFPNAARGRIPIGDLKRRYRCTNDDLRDMLSELESA